MRRRTMVALALLLGTAGAASGEDVTGTAPARAERLSIADAVLRGPSIAAGVLPMGIDLVPEDMRDALPMPLGLSASYFHVSEDLDAKKLRVSIGGSPVSTDAVSFDRLTQATDVYMLRADAWVLPFLDLYGLAGYLNGTAQHIEVSVAGTALPAFDVDYSGTVFGAGFTLAGGYGPWFLSFDMNYTATDVNALESTVSTLTIDPRTGWRTKLLGVPISGYVGAMYEGIQGSQRGSTIQAGLPISFDVEVRSQEPWNGLLGVQIELSPRWSLVAEGGLGNRHQSLVSLRCGL